MGFTWFWVVDLEWLVDEMFLIVHSGGDVDVDGVVTVKC